MIQDASITEIKKRKTYKKQKMVKAKIKKSENRFLGELSEHPFKKEIKDPKNKES